MSETDKAQQRKIALTKRMEIHANSSHEKYAKRITHFFHEWISGQKSVFVVALYHPINSEMNPLSLIEYLDTKNKTICLPMVVNKKQPLIFKPWRPGKKMVIGHYGISVPDNDQTLIPDLIICPLLAYDSKGMRLGYGGGYFDRLRQRDLWFSIPSFVVISENCISKEPLPRDRWDVPFNGWISENGLHHIEATK